MPEPPAGATGFVVYVNDLASGALSTEGPYPVMSRDIAAALEANGWPCQVLNPYQAPDLAPLFKAGKPSFVINWDMLPVMEASITIHGRPVSMHAYTCIRRLDVPVICLMADRAWHSPAYVVRPFLQEKIIYNEGDPTNFPFLRKFGVPAERICFTEYAGPPPDPAPKPFKDRARDLVFLGNYRAVASRDEFLARGAQLKCSPEAMRAALAATDRVIEQEGATDTAVVSALKESGLDPEGMDPFALAPLVFEADLRVRAVRRELFLSQLAQLPVHFFGDFYPDSFKAKFTRAQFHDRVPFAQITRIAREAKIALCDSGNAEYVANQRIVYPMAMGTLPAARTNARIARDLTDMRDSILVSYPFTDLADKVMSVLNDPNKGQEMIEAMMPVYRSRFTWRESVKALAPFLPPPLK